MKLLLLHWEHLQLIVQYLLKLELEREIISLLQGLVGGLQSLLYNTVLLLVSFGFECFESSLTDHFLHIGANVWVSSSSPEKIAKAVTLGAKDGVNYRDG